MPKEKTVVTTTLLPGAVRLVVQLYDPERHTYSQPPGHALAGVRVNNARELRRLWIGIRDLVDGGTWRDAAVRAQRMAETLSLPAAVDVDG